MSMAAALVSLSTLLAVSTQAQAQTSAQPPASAPPQTQSAQPPAASGVQPAEAMKRLDFLLGTWEGTGWIQTGRERATFRQRETVRTAAGGTVVIIDGLGRSLDPAQADRIVHQAFAVVSFDATSQQFRWRAFRADGNEIDATPEVSTDKLVWGFLPPKGPTVRFTLTRSAAGEWVEVGEVSMKPGEWMKFFEMTLKKIDS
jgi:hypothetical protein